jgi:hypothetical protein
MIFRTSLFMINTASRFRYLNGLIAALVLMSFCDYNLPYRPEQFIPPQLSVPLTSRDMIRDFLRLSTYDFKFAFTRKADRSIYVVDFSRIETGRGGESASPKVFRFKTEGTPDSPLFSSDGEWITYFVRLSATSQKPYIRKIGDNSASIEIASQGTDPHFWRDSAGGLYVIYSNKYQVSLNELPNLTGYATFRQRIDPDDGAKIASAEVLVSRPFNGGLSKEGRYLCTGYSDGALYDLADSTLYRINYEEASGGMQICNPSISPDSAHSDWMLFLPFAGTQKLDFSEMPSSPGMIKTHEYMFIVDKENKVRWQRTFPAGYFQWQDLEWTNDFNFVIALAKVTSSESDTRHDCFLVRQSDQAILKLTTDEFRLDDSSTPAFWIEQEE